MVIRNERQVITIDYRGIKRIVKNVMNNFMQIISRTYRNSKSKTIHFPGGKFKPQT